VKYGNCFGCCVCLLYLIFLFLVFGFLIFISGGSVAKELSADHRVVCERKCKELEDKIKREEARIAAEEQKRNAEKEKLRETVIEPLVFQEYKLDEINEAELQCYDDSMLVSCPKCKRTFLPNRLDIHLKSCKPKEDFQGAKTLRVSQIAKLPELTQSKSCSSQVINKKHTQPIPLRINKKNTKTCLLW
jgi:hypothetical protein